MHRYGTGASCTQLLVTTPTQHPSQTIHNCNPKKTKQKIKQDSNTDTIIQTQNIKQQKNAIMQIKA